LVDWVEQAYRLIARYGLINEPLERILNTFIGLLGEINDAKGTFENQLKVLKASFLPFKTKAVPPIGHSASNTQYTHTRRHYRV